MRLISQVNDEAQKTRIKEIKNLKTLTKSIRSGLAFAAIGLVAGLLTAVANNVISRIAKNNSEECSEC